MNEPNFFILGAPKCGTSALHEYLSAHPRIFMTDPKEPHHYSTDLPGRDRFFPRDEYLALFAGARSEHAVRGESSVYYLYSQVALPRLLADNPNAKLVVMLRSPIDMVYSLYQQLLNSLTEDQIDFATAWRLQEDRARGRSLPRTCTEPRYLQYRDVASFGGQIARALRRVPREQLHVITFDDFQSRTAEVYSGVLDFLELPHDGRTEFPRINPAAHLRWRWMQHVLDPQHIPAGVKRFARRWGLDKLHFQLKLWNRKQARREPLSSALRAELAEAFRDDVALLSDLLHRDLSSWLAA